MEIHIEGDVGRPIPRGHATTRLRQVLSRLPVHPATAHVTFADVNGPKGGRSHPRTITYRATRGLWNSFVMVARIPAFLAMIRRLSPSSFSDGVLAVRPGNLAVLPVRGIQWSDWGAPERVMGTLARLGVTPAWGGTSDRTASVTEDKTVTGGDVDSGWRRRDTPHAGRSS